MNNENFNLTPSDVLGNWYVVAQEVGKKLGEKLNDVIDTLIPRDDNKQNGK